MRLRGVLFAAILFCAAPRADASVSFTVVMDALVSESSAACVVSPVENKSVWEGGRIVTYTRAHVDRVVAGIASSEVWIKTLGGAVGDIGQTVEGEAVLRPGRQSLVFLSTYEGSLVVTARGQGQFPIVRDGVLLRVRRNLAAGALLGPSPTVLARIRTRTTETEATSPAADVLDGKTVDDAAVHVASSWQRTHAH